MSRCRVLVDHEVRESRVLGDRARWLMSSSQFTGSCLVWWCASEASW